MTNEHENIDNAPENHAEYEALMDLLMHSNLAQPLRDDAHEQHAEATALRRMMVNLGQDSSQVDDYLTDANLKDSIADWAESTLSHRGDNSGDHIFEIVSEDPVVRGLLGGDMSDTAEMSITADQGVDTVRLHASIPVTETPQSGAEHLVAAVEFTNDSRVIRFPLVATNIGDERFPLPAWVGSVTVFRPRGSLRKGWIEHSAAIDHD